MVHNELFIGIDLGGTTLKGALVNVEGHILEEKSVPTEVAGGVEHVMSRMMGVIRYLVSSAGKVPVTGVGIGCPGQVNVRKGIFHGGPNFPGWKDVALVFEIERRVGIPAVIDNDANLAALGEYAYGGGKGVEDMLLLTLGTGVGGGLILNGELYRGSTDAAGEVGHTVISLDGPECGCGRRGCLEAYVGTKGILNRLREKLERGEVSVLRGKGEATPKDIAEAAAGGDRVAMEVLREIGDLLGIGLANFANLLNVEKIVIGGGVADAGELLLGPARERMEREVLQVVRESVRLVKAELGNLAGRIGAARLAMLDRFRRINHS